MQEFKPLIHFSTSPTTTTIRIYKILIILEVVKSGEEFAKIEGMKRIILLLTLSIFLISCAEKVSDNKKEITFSDGQKVEVNFEEKEVAKDLKVFVIEYQNDNRVLKEETVEKQVLEIWKNLEAEADKTNSEEAVIKAKYFVGNNGKNGEPEYEDFLFNGEKIENGTWKIRKVN